MPGGVAVLIVGVDPAAVEKDLPHGRLTCPACGSKLRPWVMAGGANYAAGREDLGVCRGEASALAAASPTCCWPTTPSFVGVTVWPTSATRCRRRQPAPDTAKSPPPWACRRRRFADGCGASPPWSSACGVTSRDGPSRWTPNSLRSTPPGRSSLMPWRRSVSPLPRPFAAWDRARRGRWRRCSAAGRFFPTRCPWAGPD